MLKSGSCITETETREIGGIISEWGNYCGFGDIVLVYRNLKIPFKHVNFREKLALPDYVSDIGHVREGVR